MNTDPKNINPNRAPSHPELSTDTNQNRKFEAILCFTQYSRAKVIIKATKLEEAEEKAEEIEPDEIDDWNTMNGDISVMSVEPAENTDGEETND